MAYLFYFTLCLVTATQCSLGLAYGACPAGTVRYTSRIDPNDVPTLDCDGSEETWYNWVTLAGSEHWNGGGFILTNLVPAWQTVTGVSVFAYFSRSSSATYGPGSPMPVDIKISVQESSVGWFTFSLTECTDPGHLVATGWDFEWENNGEGEPFPGWNYADQGEIDVSVALSGGFCCGTNFALRLNHLDVTVCAEVCAIHECHNGAVLVPADDDAGTPCYCECSDHWSGNTCNECTLPLDFCSSRGTFSGCGCVCETGWGGVTCSECSSAELCSGHGICSSGDGSCECYPDYFRFDCSLLCTDQMCGPFGECSASGECTCVTGRYGTNCVCEVAPSCDNVECDVLGGSCGGVPGGAGCLCYPGYTGCNCSCPEGFLCSGHGEVSSGCDDPATVVCECELGWSGQDCSIFDPRDYCRSSNAGDTATGLACLPGWDVVGSGFDIVTGTKMNAKIFQISFDGDTFGDFGEFTDPDPSYFELPSNTYAFIMTTAVGLSAFQKVGSRISYERNQATHTKGVGGYIDGMYARSPATLTLVDQYLTHNSFFLHQHKEAQLYKLEVADLQLLSEEFQAAIDDLPETYSTAAYGRFIAKWGTHYVESAVFGGRHQLHVQGHSCMEYVSSTVISGEAGVALDVGSNGIDARKEKSITQETEGAAFWEYVEQYHFITEGGDPLLAMTEDMRDWVGSISDRPALLQVGVQGIESLIESPEKWENMGRAIGEYLADAVTEDVETVPIPEDECVSQFSTAGGVQIGPSWWSHFLVVALGVARGWWF